MILKPNPNMPSPISAMSPLSERWSSLWIKPVGGQNNRTDHELTTANPASPIRMD